MTSAAKRNESKPVEQADAKPEVLGRENDQQRDQRLADESVQALPEPGDKVSDDSAAGRVGPPFAVNETPVGKDGAGDPRPSNE